MSTKHGELLPAVRGFSDNWFLIRLTAGWFVLGNLSGNVYSMGGTSMAVNNLTRSNWSV